MAQKSLCPEAWRLQYAFNLRTLDKPESGEMVWLPLLPFFPISCCVSLSLSLCLTLCLSSNASLTNIITSCCEEIFVSTIFPIFYWIIYTVHHSFIYICTLGIYWALFWELFCNTFVRIKIFQFNIQCTKNSRTLCGQEDARRRAKRKCSWLQSTL